MSNYLEYLINQTELDYTKIHSNTVKLWGFCGRCQILLESHLQFCDQNDIQQQYSY